MEAQQDQEQDITDVLNFLNGSKPAEKNGALDIILPYSATTEYRKLFAGTEACRLLLRQLPEQNRQIVVKSLKCLINFSQDKKYIEELCELNASQRVYELLKEVVKQDLQNSHEETTGVKMKLSENVFELVKREPKIDETTGKLAEEDTQELTIEYCFMLLSNLSAIEVGQKHILGLNGEGKFKFIVAESIFGMFCYFQKNTSFDFVSNIMANLACCEAGRKFMIEHQYIEAIVVNMVTKYLNAHRRKYLMACLRNLFFEYQEYEQKFLDMNVPRDVCKLLIDEQGLVEDDLPEKWQQWKAKTSKGETGVDYENSMALIDSLILMGNSDALLERMYDMDLQSLLTKIRFPPTPEYEEDLLRVQVLQNQLVSVPQEKELREKEKLEMGQMIDDMEKREELKDNKEDDEEMPALENVE